MKKFINIIHLQGRLHCCPDLHETEEEANKALMAVLGKYRTHHIRFVTEPIEIGVLDGV